MKRQLKQLIPARTTCDGAGVRIKRSLGQTHEARFDPFLMLDEIDSENADDYISGFPSHPHRGFETVTYMLKGHLLHEDHLGNKGTLASGGVQWMTAGRGIIHSEMPQRERGKMHCFQLWLNLPAAEKMQAASYRDIPVGEIPVVNFANGGSIRVIAGTIRVGKKQLVGPIRGMTTEPRFWDAELPAGSSFEQVVPRGLNAFLYVYAGELAVGDSQQMLQKGFAGLLSDGEILELTAGGKGARVLILAGKPLGEPIAQYGPFVMNTPDEIEEAIRDYREGRLGAD